MITQGTLGWVIAAFLAGLLLGKWQRKQTHVLQDQFNRLNICKGMSYVEILHQVQTAPRIIERNANGDTERTWVDQAYSITLVFDWQDICLGVQEEVLHKG